MEKRTEKRKKGTPADLELAYNEDGEREKRDLYSKHRYVGIVFSSIILISFVYFMVSRVDILHIALFHDTADYHPTHVAEKIHGISSALKQPAAINFNMADNYQVYKEKGDFLKVKKDLLDVEPQLHHKVMIPPLHQEQQSDHAHEEDNSANLAVPQQASKVNADTSSFRKVANNQMNLQTLQEDAEKQIAVVRKLKFEDNLVMETDPRAKAEIAILQQKVRTFLQNKYGKGPYYVEMSLKFPDSMLMDGRESVETILIELAPIEFIPYCVYYFLQIVENWKGGAFHRNAGHVLQAMVHSQANGLAFQEYSPEFPHVKYTMGYAGRPGGPAFYISTVDNTRNHGPASQGSKTEADGCFGKIVKGFNVVERMKKQPGGQKGSGFVMGSENYIKIPRIRLIPASEVHLDSN